MSPTPRTARAWLAATRSTWARTPESPIQFDGSKARGLSVREAARLQSCPRSFWFCGAMNPAYQQIGKAVRPLLAWRIAGPCSSLGGRFAK
jgi:site-specific DNA-cytosine methylase